MLKRELIRIGLCAVIGLVLGIMITINYNNVQYVIISPFYGIGSYYGIRMILVMLGGIGKTAGRSLFSSLAGGHWMGLLMTIILLVIAAGVVFLFGWIIGIFIAGKALFDAYRTDSELNVNSKPIKDDWDDVKKKKPEKSNDVDYSAW